MATFTLAAIHSKALALSGREIPFNLQIPGRWEKGGMQRQSYFLNLITSEALIMSPLLRSPKQHFVLMRKPLRVITPSGKALFLGKYHHTLQLDYTECSDPELEKG